MITFIKHYIPASYTRTRPGRKMAPTSITIHGQIIQTYERTRELTLSSKQMVISAKRVGTFKLMMSVKYMSLFRLLKRLFIQVRITATIRVLQWKFVLIKMATTTELYSTQLKLRSIYKINIHQLDRSCNIIIGVVKIVQGF